MTHVRRVITVGTLVLFVGLPVARVESSPDVKAADYFTTKWSQITYTKTDTIQNASATKQGTSESLLLSCAITIRDPNLVLGTLQQGVVTQLTGRQGQDLSVSPPSSRAEFPYERPRYAYAQRSTQPPKEPRWRAMVRSILRIAPDQSPAPKLVWELQPSPMNLQLDSKVLDQAGGRLRHVKGYFHALVAESLESVDVPFEPNDRWVRLTPDLEIQLRQASCTASSFQYRIETRPQNEYSPPLKRSDPPPSRLVVAQQLLGPDGKPRDDFPNAEPWLPVQVRTGMSGGGTNCQITALRFIIAVNPAHCRIAFDFQRIPLPDPNQPPARYQSGQ
jgi:hypothetical protein